MKNTIEDKGHVVVHTCELELPKPMDITLVCLEMVTGQERRFRTRVGGGIEGRVTVSDAPHYQDEKRHPDPGMYTLQRGWIAILVPNNDFSGGYEVDVAFAKASGKFFVMAPGCVWYAAFISGDVAYTYAASNNETGEVRKYTVDLPDEATILGWYAEQHNMNAEDVESLRSASFA